MPVCATDETLELRNDEVKVHKEPYVEAAEFGSVDSGGEILQILASASEFEICKRGESSGRRWGLCCLGWAGMRGLESKDKLFEFWQLRYASGLRLAVRCSQHVVSSEAGVW